MILKGNHTLYVDGALRVLGTVADPVIFTSEKDDSAGGDSNNDGNDSAPNRGESLRMYFRASSIDSSNLVKNAQFRYSSNAIYFENADAKIVEGALVEPLLQVLPHEIVEQQKVSSMAGRWQKT